MDDSQTNMEPESEGEYDDKSRRERRWRLTLDANEDALSTRDRQLSKALTALYGDGERTQGK